MGFWLRHPDRNIRQPSGSCSLPASIRLPGHWLSGRSRTTACPALLLGMNGPIERPIVAATFLGSMAVQGRPAETVGDSGSISFTGDKNHESGEHSCLHHRLRRPASYGIGT